jgi:DNA-binding NtrC family response regulator
MPMATQARLLRVLESGEFIKVGSSKVLKTDVRVVAATNVQIQQAIEKNKFREDLYYRLNTVPIMVPPLRERKQDIFLLMRKFAADFAAKYRMPVIKLTADAEQILINYYWQGNVRQLKNITEQISVIERNREIDGETLKKYLPDLAATNSNFPMVLRGEQSGGDFSERDLLYKVLFDMKRDLAELKKLVVNIIQREGDLPDTFTGENERYLQQIYSEINPLGNETSIIQTMPKNGAQAPVQQSINLPVEESLSLEDREIELINKALDKSKGKRKNAAKELGISERTLYRKINEYNIKK